MSSSPPPPSQAPTGELLADRYQLERRIGQGGMAEVWVATDTDLDRKVAVKWLKTNLAADPVVAERFRREAIAVARLSHPNIVAIHDVFLHDGRQAVVMQLVDGKSLRQLLDSQKRLGPELTIHIGAAIAGALDEAHRAGFVHRDVKPGNILVTSDGRVLLTDFGIAKGLQPGDEDLTSDNVMMGTAKYLSPEQVRGRQLDGRADLYSLALVLYECLAGRVPFLGQSDADTALARLQRDPTDLGNLRPTLPIGLVNLIHRTLARNPAHRPQTGAELRSALLAVDTDPPPIDRTPADPPLRAGAAVGADRPVGVPGDPHLNAADALAKRSASARHAPVPTRRSQRSARSTPPPMPRVAGGDDTPPAIEPMRGAPAKQDQQRWTPSLVVVSLLLVVALSVAGVLFIGLNRGDQSDEFTGDTVVPEDTGPDEDGSAAATTVATAAADGDAPAGSSLPASPGPPVDIVSIAAFDPFGDNETENDAQAEQARADDSSSTAWPTECYSDAFLNGKGGVGLLIELSGAGTGTLTADSLNAPYRIDVYSFNGADPPTDLTQPSDLDQWSKVGDTRVGDAPGTVEAVVATPATHLLLWLNELGRDEVCSDANPYRGRLDEVAFRP